MVALGEAVVGEGEAAATGGVELEALLPVAPPDGVAEEPVGLAVVVEPPPEAAAAEGEASPENAVATSEEDK
jgi:hypothetical protein